MKNTKKILTMYLKYIIIQNSISRHVRSLWLLMNVNNYKVCKLMSLKVFLKIIIFVILQILCKYILLIQIISLPFIRNLECADIHAKLYSKFLSH